MNTKCFININIYHHNNITAKLWVLANLNANTRALIYQRQYGFVAERIKHKASHMLIYREKNSNPVSGRFFIMQASQPATILK